jgi:hypothetical protein
MTYSINQHWDPLQVCVVGRSYPPEFYSFISNTNVRSVMERIAVETEQDLQNLVAILESFNVDVLRPIIDNDFTKYHVDGKYLPAPISPRDDMAMIGENFFMPTTNRYGKWNSLRGSLWPTMPPSTWNDLSVSIKKELVDTFNVNCLLDLYYRDYASLKNIEDRIKSQGNTIVYDKKIDSAMISRIGRDLYFGTWPGEDKTQLQRSMSEMFPEYRCHVIETNGHLDGTFCPITEGLIISSHHIKKSEFDLHFPGWEVVYVDSTYPYTKFNQIKEINSGRWWVSGEETNSVFANFVETYIQNWTGTISETYIGVNILMIDKNNALCIAEDPVIFKIFDQYNITPHVVPFRHYGFWDNGLHCLTNDLHRNGDIKDYFPERKCH